MSLDDRFREKVMQRAPVDLSYKSQPDNTDFGDIPGEFGYPLVGVALEMVRDITAFSEARYRRYGNISKAQLGKTKGLIVLGVDNAQKVFLDSEQEFSNEMGYKPLAQVYPGGLLVKDFGEHKTHRRILQGAFKTSAMKQYVDSINALTASQISGIGAEKKFTFYPFIKRTLLEVGTKIFIGLDQTDAECDRLNTAFLHINEALGAPVRWDIPGTRFHRGLKSREYLYDFLGSLVSERRDGTEGDMLSYMCRETDEDGRRFPESDIARHAAFLLFAAHDTTTSALTHLMMYLGRFPEWQERLRNECLDLGKEQISYENLDSLKCLDHAFSECLRLHPPVALLSRRTTRDLYLEGTKVPAHTVLWLFANHNHRDANYWSVPDLFDPERFAPGREEHKRHSFAYHPYGGGAHKCIGLHFAPMLAKCFMFQLLLNYKIETPTGYRPKLDSIPLPKPADDLPVTLTRIEH